MNNTTNEVVFTKEFKKLYNENGILVYEGETFKDCAFGKGTSYYADGTVSQEGEFDVKGFVKGKEYYPNGQLRFSGSYEVNHAYGPNYPVEGAFYSPNGDLIFEGQFKHRIGGVGWRTVMEPAEWRKTEPARPHVPTVRFDDLRPDDEKENLTPLTWEEYRQYIRDYVMDHWGREELHETVEKYLDANEEYMESDYQLYLEGKSMGYPYNVGWCMMMEFDPKEWER